MLTRRRAAELRAARERFDPSELVIGWNVGTPGRATESYREAVAVGLAKAVADHRDVRVQATCEPDDIPASVRAQVRAEGGALPADEIGTWTVHLFTPAAVGEELADDLLPFTEAGYAGVPTVLPSPARPAIDGFVAPALVVQDPDEPEQWSAALCPVLESTARGARELSAEARRRADSIDAAATVEGDGEPTRRLGPLQRRARSALPSGDRAMTPVTIIVPVYGGLDDIRRCLESVVAARGPTRHAFELLVIDDASPEPAVSAYLDELRRRAAPVPAHGPAQRGEPRFRGDGEPRAAASGGRRRDPQRRHRRDRGLARPARRDRGRVPDVATVTPLTSHGSICTLPDSVIDAFDLESADAAHRRVRRVRRRALAAAAPRGDHRRRLLHVRDACGARRCAGCSTRTPSDAGYGEEVDFCLRAHACWAAAPRRGLDVRVPPRRRLVRRRPKRGLASQLGDPRRALSVLPARRTARAERTIRCSVPFAALELGLHERRRRATARAAHVAQPARRDGRHREFRRSR